LKRKELLLFHIGVFLILGGVFFGVLAYYYCEVYPVYRADDERVIEKVIVISPQRDIPENITSYRLIHLDLVSTTVYPLRMISLSLFVAGVVILTYALWTSGFRMKIEREKQ